MDLEDELLREHSRKHAEKIARWVGADSDRMKTLMHLFLKGDFRTSQRAAWVVSISAERDPQAFRRYLRQMISRMQEPGIHDAVRRCVIRIMQKIDIPDDLLGAVTNACFEQLTSDGTPVAVKCFSMTVLARIAEREPELGRELQLVIEQQLPFASAGFKARASKTVAQLRIKKK